MNIVIVVKTSTVLRLHLPSQFESVTMTNNMNKGEKQYSILL